MHAHSNGGCLIARWRTVLAVCCVGALGSAPLQSAMASELTLVSLEWRPAVTTVEPGQLVELGLFAVVPTGETQLLRAVDMVFEWDPAHLALIGLSQSGAVGLLGSAFPAADAYGLNEVVPPQDGDGYYQVLAPIGTPVTVTPLGVRLTTFRFQALADTPGTQLRIVVDGGSGPILQTVVFGGGGPNRNRTGALGAATVAIGDVGACCRGGVCEETTEEQCASFLCNVTTNVTADCGGPCGTVCFGDIEGNGVVNPGDRGFISANIGQTAYNLVCQHDLDGNGVINPGDRGFVSANIGACTALPDFQNGSGLNGGVPDTRFPPGVFHGPASSCSTTMCP